MFYDVISGKSLLLDNYYLLLDRYFFLANPN